MLSSPLLEDNHFWPRKWHYIMRLGFKLLWNLKPFTICSTSHCAIHTKHPPFHVTLSLFLSPHSFSFLPLHLMLLLFNVLAVSVSLVKWPQRLFLIWRSWCTLVLPPGRYILHTPLQDVNLDGASGRSREKDIWKHGELLTSTRFSLSSKF